MARTVRKTREIRKISTLLADLNEHARALDQVVPSGSIAAGALSGAGAIDLTKKTILFTSTGAGQALTIAAGELGQRIRIVHKVDGGSGVLTGTFDPALTSITLTTVRASVELEMTAVGWAIIGYTGVSATDITFT